MSRAEAARIGGRLTKPPVPRAAAGRLIESRPSALRYPAATANGTTPYPELRGAETAEPEWFRDPRHLSRRGAPAFTRQMWAQDAVSEPILAWMPSEVKRTALARKSEGIWSL